MYQLNKEILEILRCPATQSNLKLENDLLINQNNQKYPVISNIMHLIVSTMASVILL